MATVAVSDAVHRKLKEFCFKQDRQIKDVVDEAIIKYLREKGVEI